MEHPHPGELNLAYNIYSQKLMRSRSCPGAYVKVQAERNSGGLIPYKFWELGVVKSNLPVMDNKVSAELLKVEYNTATIRLINGSGSKTIRIRIQPNGRQYVL